MKKILIVTITLNSAVDRLAEMVQKHNEHLDIDIFPFHAKRFSKADLQDFEYKAKDADLIDFEYWKGADVLLKTFPWLQDKKKILTHHNPYDLEKINPALFDGVVVKNKTQQANLAGSVLIPHAVDMNFYDFSEDYCTDCNKCPHKCKTVGMVAFRIEGNKGIREVAQVCKDLGYKFLLVGKASKLKYMKEVWDTGADIEFVEDATDEQLKDAYYRMSMFVCNSVDGFESGTMPILEAMACGVPVLTRRIGFVPEVSDGENMAVREGETEDIDDLKEELSSLMSDGKRRLKMREEGWQTVKRYNSYRMAKMYTGLYNKVSFPNAPLVSIITSTYHREKQVGEIIDALNFQTYPNIELIVCDDNSIDGTENLAKSKREEIGFPIKYLNTETQGYNLAMARNLGLIEAEGKFVAFLDSRLLPAKDAIETMVNGLCKTERKERKKKVFVFGEKGSSKKSFVENFSLVRRYYIIRSGMFNERITEYGGMSQEIRRRLGSQGFEFVFLPEAKAEELITAKSGTNKKKSVYKMKNLLWKIGLEKK